MDDPSPRKLFLSIIRDITSGAVEKAGYTSTGRYIADKYVVPRLIDLLCDSEAPAIGAADGRRALTHRELKHFVFAEFDVSVFGIGPKDRVGVVLGGGAELAVCIMACAAYCCCAPVNAQNTVEEILADLVNVRCKAVIVSALAGSELIGALERAGMLVAILEPDEHVAGLFRLRSVVAPSSDDEEDEDDEEGFPEKDFTTAKDAVLVLHTSGTSGKKKVVPYPLENIVIGAACLIAAGGLTEGDVNLNLMPLYHIGGIARNLFSPVLSGGSAVMMADFDPVLFWDVIEPSGATWYYAAPTMHHMILQEGKSRDPVPETKIRMIVNAAGGLVPSLAIELRDFFKNCTVLPSYGMTECMPISAPPLDYKLERTGTSGRPIAAEVSIRSDDGEGCSVGATGNICLKGPPLMPGYENNPEANVEAFDKEGWFNTGDMGYMDKDGYIYINGRSKEVINRGGEIISPFEIEEAVLQHKKIKQVLAFSVPHDVLQEAVGVVIVSAPGVPRIGLDGLRRFLTSLLHSSKFPIVIVHMDDLPRNSTNKVLRINLATRFGMKDFSDKMSKIDRIFEAECPPKGTPLQKPIPCKKVTIDYDKLHGAVKGYAGVGMVKTIAVGKDNLLCAVTPASIDHDALMHHLLPIVHEYSLPTQLLSLDKFPTKSDGSIDEDALIHLHSGRVGGARSPSSPQEQHLLDLFLEVLQLDGGVSIDDDFFEIGGTSLAAGRLIACIRKRFGVKMSPAQIFSLRTVAKIAEMLEPNSSRSRGISIEAAPNVDQVIHVARKYPPYSEKLHHCAESSRPFCMFIQLLPLVIMYPLLRMIGYSTFIVMLQIQNSRHYAIGDSTNLERIFLHLTVALIVARVVNMTVPPILAIIFKWIVIGRFKQGRYRLFGSYYLRRWIVNQFLEMAGKEIFLLHSSLHRWYWRLLGARIGSNVTLADDVHISEPDLVMIDSNSCIDSATISPFCFDRGSMVLQRIRIGRYCSVGAKSVIAAGTDLDDGTHLGPLSSSYEDYCATPENYDSCRTAFPSPPLWMKLLIGSPILVFVGAFSLLPYAGALVGLSMFNWSDLTSIIALLRWFSSNERLLYLILLRFARVTAAPFFRMAAAIAMKWIIIGRFEEGPRSNSNWDKFRHWLMGKLVNHQHIKQVARVLGTHYEGVSVLYRLLGAKIGKHIYWPGSGVQLVEYDLFEVGDNVVFGSRSIVICSDRVESKKVRLEEGAMLADRCVLLPGVTIKKGAVMGSGGLGRKDLSCNEGSTWVGSKGGSALLWNEGNKQEALAADSTTPFAKAFYLGKSSYFCMPLWMHMIMNAFVTTAVTLFWLLPLIACLKVITDLVYPVTTKFIPDNSVILFTLLGLFACYFLFATLFALFFFILIKWLVIGRRAVGEYPWDKSSYCQRWQIYLVLQQLIEKGAGGFGLLQALSGSEWLVMYFRSLGAKIGENVCLYPNSADPMMTEPELVTIGDRSCVDNASVIAHLNSRGLFSLNRVTVGADCTLRCFSRLLSGATMENGSVLLEHTLITSGDIVDSHSVWQGWPGQAVISHNQRRSRRSGTNMRTRLSSQKRTLRPTAEEGGVAKPRKHLHMTDMPIQKVDLDHVTGHALRGLPSARDDRELRHMTRAMVSVSAWSIIAWIVQIFLLSQSSSFPLSCLGNDVVNTVPLDGILQYIYTPATIGLSCVYTILTAVLVLMLVRYYLLLHRQKCNLRIKRGLDTPFFPIKMILRFLLEVCVCLVQPLPLYHVEAAHTWENRQVVLGTFMFLRLYHGIRAAWYESEMYRRRHAILSSIDSHLPVDYDWWLVFKTMMTRRPFHAAAFVGLSLIFIFSVSLYAAEWPALLQVKCVDGVMETLTFGDLIYMTVVTMSTTGYGDFAPKTSWGQAIASLAIVSGVVGMAVSVVSVTTRQLHLSITDKAPVEWTRIHSHEGYLRHAATNVISRFWLYKKGRRSQEAVVRALTQFHACKRHLIDAKMEYHKLMPVPDPVSYIRGAFDKVHQRLHQMEKNQIKILKKIKQRKQQQQQRK